MITIPMLSDVIDILDTDQVMVTNEQGQSYKIAGSELNKRHKVIIADSTTVTGAPLKTGNCVRICFTADITANNTTTVLQINYNNVNYYVKVPKNGALENFVAFNLGGSPAVYKYVQAYTTLELLFDGTQFIIMCNPVVISGTNFTIFADGLKRVDEVTENGTDMVTSHAVASAIDKVKDIMRALPTDAILHYSFDELPDYPDGTADVRLLDNNTYDIQSTNYKFSDVNQHGTIFTNVNGKLQIEIQTGSDYGAQILNSYIRNKCIKLKINVTSISGIIRVKDGTGSGGITLLEITKTGIYECAFTHDSSPTYNNFYILTSGATSSATFTVEQIYIGDGSYSTPIIDNANGQNNATNNGGIAVKGVSGKGILLPARTSGEITVSSLIPNTDRDISISLWAKFDTSYSQTNQLGLFTMGTANGLFGLLRIGSGNNVNIQALARVSASETSGVTVSLQKGAFYHLTMIYDSSVKKVRFYVNGEYKGQGNALTTGNFDFGETTQFLWKINRVNNVQGTSTDDSIVTPHVLDDLLIFDRALTADEVTALYLNKANTPKYYSWADWKLSQSETVQTRNVTPTVALPEPRDENER